MNKLFTTMLLFGLCMLYSGTQAQTNAVFEQASPKVFTSLSQDYLQKFQKSHLVKEVKVDATSRVITITPKEGVSKDVFNELIRSITDNRPAGPAFGDKPTNN